VKVPNADRAIVDPRKLRDYLLSPEHPVGSAKARWFSRCGFTRARWQELETAVRELIASNPAESSILDGFGRRFSVTGMIQAPSGRQVRITSVWMIRIGEEVPRFITAFPSE
jgi:hypothetical protein